MIVEFGHSFSLNGPTSVCPDIQGIEYTSNEVEGYSYEWTVTGGTIKTGQGTSQITVDWGSTNSNAQVRLKTSSGGLCEEELFLKVIVNVRLEPPLPEGPAIICFTDLTSIQTYSTPYANGSNYTWKVTNGKIVAGNGTNEVQVLWNGLGTGALFFTESASSVSNACDGDSPVLRIDLREEIIPTLSISNVSCFEGSDASVEVTSVVGVTPFSYKWNTQGLGTPNSNNIVGLPAGNYSVDVTSGGCTITTNFTITEPTMLEGTIETMDVLCFGGQSGEASATITGGTPPYSYRWSSDSFVNSSSIGKLKFGDYELVVTDENDCVLALSFSISEPLPLIIDSIAATLVTCPEGSDGTLEAFVSGGTPPYSFVWNGVSDTGPLAIGFPKGIHGMTVIDANGCTTSSSQEVLEAMPLLFMPTAFSPNGDGINDIFAPTAQCNFDFQLTIYNRWGTPIFHTIDIAKGWNGTFEGKPVPNGNYGFSAAWVITANNQVISEERRGTLQLFR